MTRLIRKPSRSCCTSLIPASIRWYWWAPLTAVQCTIISQFDFIECWDTFVSYREAAVPVSLLLHFVNIRRAPLLAVRCTITSQTWLYWVMRHILSHSAPAKSDKLVSNIVYWIDKCTFYVYVNEKDNNLSKLEWVSLSLRLKRKADYAPRSLHTHKSLCPGTTQLTTTREAVDWEMGFCLFNEWNKHIIHLLKRSQLDVGTK